jgi:hypothetical protein
LRNIPYIAALRFSAVMVSVQNKFNFQNPTGDNPNGIASFSPGLAAPADYPGSRFKLFSTPTGLNHRATLFDATLSGLFSLSRLTQRSRFASTLG